MNHPLAWHFRKWKNGDDAAKKKLKDLTKSELIDKIVEDELAIGAAKSRVDRMNDAIENLTL